MVQTFQDILKDFDPTKKSPAALEFNITICVTEETKARYEKLQAATGRQFASKAREALTALMDLAEKKTG